MSVLLSFPFFFYWKWALLPDISIAVILSLVASCLLVSPTQSISYAAAHINGTTAGLAEQSLCCWADLI